MNTVSIIKILFELKLRNYYKNIARMFGIYLNNKVYFAYRILKTVLVFASLNLLYNLYFEENYANYVIAGYSIMLVLLNVGFAGTITKGVLKPRNVELYQISAIELKNVSILFLLVEYIWKKFKEADLLIPFFVMAVKIGGNKAILYTFCIESILLLILIFRIYIHKNIRQEKMHNISIVNFALYVLICGIIVRVTSLVVTKALEISKIAREYFDTFDSLNQDTLYILENRLSDYFKNSMNSVKRALNIDILNVADWRIMVLVIVVAVALCYFITHRYSINYGRVTYELNHKIGNVKEKYLVMIKKLSTSFNNQFLIEKDLKILRNKISFLNKSIFSTVFLPYDFFIIITFVYCLKQNTGNDYLIVLCVIFGMVSILFNQINTISSTFSSIFRFEPDMKNAELYKISKYSIEDVLKAKIRLCRIMSFAPFLITVIISGCLLLGVGVSLTQNLGFLIVMLMVAVSVYFFAPNMKLYIYKYLMEKEIISDEEKMEEKIDELTNRFCEIPRKLLILPMMYVLLINSVFRLLEGNEWQTILYIYLVWLTVMLTLELLFVRKISERSMNKNNEQIW